MPENIIEISNLSVARGHVPVLKNLTMTISRGAPFAVIGESGSGKTTLLYSMLGLIKNREGIIRVNGQVLSSLKMRERARIIGLVFQDYQLFPHLNVLENVSLALECSKQEIPLSEIDTLFAQLKISGFEKRYPHELSGGQKQRVAIARSLMLKPKVLLFDEPSSALDSGTTRDLALLLARLNEQSQIVIVSHDTLFLEQVCPRGALLKNGQTVQEGELRSLIHR